MDLSQAGRLDGHILLGILNEKLRLECGSFEELAITYDFNSAEVEHRLQDMGYHYDPLTNQFKAR